MLKNLYKIALPAILSSTFIYPFSSQSQTTSPTPPQSLSVMDARCLQEKNKNRLLEAVTHGRDPNDQYSLVPAKSRPIGFSVAVLPSGFEPPPPGANNPIRHDPWLLVTPIYPLGYYTQTLFSGGLADVRAYMASAQAKCDRDDDWRTLPWAETHARALSDSECIVTIENFSNIGNNLASIREHLRRLEVQAPKP